MKKISLVVILSLSGLFLGACGALGAFSASAKDSAQLQQRHEALDQKLDTLEETLRVYGPLAEEFGPEFKDKFDKIQAGLTETRAYMTQAKELHAESLEKAKKPDGSTDWLSYAMNMLLGGGILYQRNRTLKDRGRLHKRVDEKNTEVAQLVEQMKKMAHEMEVEKARRETPPA